ncbi:MAG: hypothetical protein ACE5HU_06485 [Acidobacteriota bacterium]
MVGSGKRMMRGLVGGALALLVSGSAMAQVQTARLRLDGLT